MKNNYRKLKLSILLQTVFVTALTVLVGGVILEFVIDGIYNDSFANLFVQFMRDMNVSEETAVSLYWQLIGDNKVFFMILGFLALFSLFFYIALSKMTKYLDQVGEGIENILSDSAEPIHLITELKPLELKLNEIKNTLKRQEQEAAQIEQKKNDLVLFLAHDLKTPLTSVVAYLSMLDSHPEMSVEERARYTHISLEKAIRLGDLISEFFEITKFNLQDIVLEPVELNLTMMLEQIADELYGVLQEKGLSCQVEAEEELIIYGDPDKLARVFDNILRNAIVYCKENTSLEISAVLLGDAVGISFANEGEKIPEEQLERIFDKFYRADLARSSSTGGAGLGLAIAKEIVELHGGTIRAESDEEKRQGQRDARQGIDQKGQMPVHIGQIARDDGGQHEGQVVDRRTVAQLAHAVIAREIIDHESRRKRNHHACADAEDTADDDQPRHALGKDAGDAAQKEDRKSDGENPEFVPAHGEASRKQHEGDDKQRRKRGQHLNFEVGGFGKYPVQIPQNRRYGKSRQRGDRRHGPDRQQYRKRDRTFSCFDFHCPVVYRPTPQLLYQTKTGRHAAGPLSCLAYRSSTYSPPSRSAPACRWRGHTLRQARCRPSR